MAYGWTLGGVVAVRADGLGRAHRPTAPANLAATPNGTTAMDLAWTASTGTVTGYKVERGTNGIDFAQVGTTATNSYADTGLAADTTYHYRVRGYNAAEDGGYSDTDSATAGSGGAEEGPPSSARIADGTLATWFAANTGPTGSMTTSAGVTMNATWLANNADSGAGTSGNPYIVDGWDFTGEITVNAAGAYITLRNFRIASTSFYAVFGTNFAYLTLEDGEITGTSAGAIQAGSNYTARRVEVHDCEQDGFKVGTNVLIELCYVHNIGTGDPETVHADGVQVSDGGGNVVVRRTFFDMPYGQPGSTNNACIIVKPDFGPIDDVEFSDNWATGGNYAVQSRSGGGNPAPTNVVITGNRWGPPGDFNFGVLDLEGTVTSTGNVWDSDGTAKNS